MEDQLEQNFRSSHTDGPGLKNTFKFLPLLCHTEFSRNLRGFIVSTLQDSNTAKPAPNEVVLFFHTDGS